MSDLVPDGWVLGDLTNFSEINPKLNQQTVLTDNLSVSFIKMEDVSNNAKVRNKRIRKYNKVSKGFTKFNDHDVLVAKITPCFENGKGGYVEQLMNGIGFGSTEFHVLRAKSDVDSKFLYHYTNFSSFRLDAEASMCGTGGQRRVQTDFLRTYKVAFPPLPEQQKIVKILTSVDEVIEKTQAQIDKLKYLKTGMMQELLTNGIGNNGKPHTQFKDSPVGKIPAEWEVYELGQLASKIEGGGTPSKNEPLFWIREIPWASVKDLKAVKLSLTQEYISQLGLDNSACKLIPANTMILASRMAVGKAVMFDKDVAINQDLKAFYPKKNLDSQFLLHWYLSKANYIESLGTGSTVKGIRLEDLKILNIALPSVEEQRKLASIFTSIDETINKKKSKIKIILNTKKALMQDLLTGKIRVKVI